MSEFANPSVADGAPAAGWYADPMARAEYRWFDGGEWTRRISVQGVARCEPLRAKRAGPPLEGIDEPTTAPAPHTAPPGWYELTPGSGSLRWWDGVRWTEDEAVYPHAQAS